MCESILAAFIDIVSELDIYTDTHAKQPWSIFGKLWCAVIAVYAGNGTLHQAAEEGASRDTSLMPTICPNFRNPKVKATPELVKCSPGS